MAITELLAGLVDQVGQVVLSSMVSPAETAMLSPVAFRARALAETETVPRLVSVVSLRRMKNSQDSEVPAVTE